MPRLAAAQARARACAHARGERADRAAPPLQSGGGVPKAASAAGATAAPSLRLPEAGCAQCAYTSTGSFRSSVQKVVLAERHSAAALSNSKYTAWLRDHVNIR
ncbi:unnamed protein product, partial [Prorocentrum cordatum]